MTNMMLFAHLHESDCLDLHTEAWRTRTTQQPANADTQFQRYYFVNKALNIKTEI